MIPRNEWFTAYVLIYWQYPGQVHDNTTHLPVQFGQLLVTLSHAGRFRPLPGRPGAAGGGPPLTVRDWPRPWPRPLRRRAAVCWRKNPFSFRLRSTLPLPTSRRRLNSTPRSACTSGYGVSNMYIILSKRGVPFQRRDINVMRCRCRSVCQSVHLCYCRLEALSVFVLLASC